MGKAKITSTMAHSTLQQNIGIFMSVMPGARMLSTVVIKLMAPPNDAMPELCRYLPSP